ncbi:hypothetical protein ILUMI_21244, partial [Ignelater luminosus]
MILCYRRHQCKQLIRGKSIRYGYNFWIGATSKGYVVWMEPYQGAKSVIEETYREYVHTASQIHREQNGKMDQATFRRRIAIAMLEESTPKLAYKRSRPSSLKNADRRYDRMDHFIHSQEKQTRCRVCYKK